MWLIYNQVKPKSVNLQIFDYILYKDLGRYNIEGGQNITSLKNSATDLSRMCVRV